MNPLYKHYLGSTLIATQPGAKFIYPGSTIIDYFQPGDEIGKVEAVEKTGSGSLFWKLNDGTYVKHDPRMFDKRVAKMTSDNEKNKEELQIMAIPRINIEDLFKQYSTVIIFIIILILFINEKH